MPVITLVMLIVYSTMMEWWCNQSFRKTSWINTFHLKRYVMYCNSMLYRSRHTEKQRNVLLSFVAVAFIKPVIIVSAHWAYIFSALHSFISIHSLIHTYYWLYMLCIIIIIISINLSMKRSVNKMMSVWFVKVLIFQDPLWSVLVVVSSWFIFIVIIPHLRDSRYVAGSVHNVVK